MKFPNLRWALFEKGFAYWRFAGQIPLDPSAFSRRLNGRGDFNAGERERIASLLGYPAAWLFEEPAPPNRVYSQEHQPCDRRSGR
jgi:hypothetical protein